MAKNPAPAAKRAPANKPAPATPTPAPAPAPAATPPALYGSDKFPATFDLGDGATATLGDIVRAAFEATGATVDAWNEFDQPWRDAAIATALNDAGVTWPPELVAEQTAEVVTDAPTEELVGTPAEDPAPGEGAPIEPAQAPAEDDAPEAPLLVDLGPIVHMTLIVSLSGADADGIPFCLGKDDNHACSAAEGGRLIVAGFASPATDEDRAIIDAYLAGLPSA